MKKSILLLISLFAIMLAVSACNTNSGNVVVGNGDGVEVKATIFRSESCGCCGLYSSYMGKKGFDFEVVQIDDLDSIKDKYKIPAKMQSCHTTIIGDYFIEGHVPVEAIEKLLAEKPDIAGIAMPGMPSGSPGMPGSKRGPFIGYAVNKDGSTAEFMRI